MTIFDIIISRLCMLCLLEALGSIAMYGITKQNQTLAILGKSDLDRKTDFFL